MSEETAQRLQEARAEEDRRRAEVDQLKLKTLADVAAGIPGRIEEIAKRTAHSQPEVTKQLGTEGVKALRSDLAVAAATLASQVEAAADAIKWPKKAGSFSKVSKNDIHSALFNFMYGSPVNAIAEVLRRHGYNIADNGQQSRSILPQSLYDESEFDPLATALNALVDTEGAVAKAKADDDRDAVESLWQD